MSRALTITWHRRSRMAAATAVAIGCSLWLAGASQAAPASGHARAVPRQGYGTGSSAVGSISCTSPGTCAAAGYFSRRISSFLYQDAFVISQSHGAWGKPLALTGPKYLDTFGSAFANSVSCAEAGDCAVGGDYTASGAAFPRVFLASQLGGHWRPSIEVPGSRAFQEDTGADISSVSCPAPGDCAAGGYIAGTAILVTQVRGHWRRAIAAPGLHALAKGGGGAITSLSCAAPGECAAGGYYEAPGFRVQGFVVDERDGHWSNAIDVPGLRALNVGGGADVTSVSCASPGNCAAGGYYSGRLGGAHAFVASRAHGHWSRALEVPGSRALNARARGTVASVSCPASGGCTAAGIYKNRNGTFGVFVTNQSDGRWSTATPVPGLGRLAFYTGGKSFLDAFTLSLSCAAAGDCGLAASSESTGTIKAYVASEVNRAWSRATSIVGFRSAAIYAISCPAPGDCLAGGAYSFRSDIRGFHAFVLGEVDGVWGHVRPVFGPA